MAYVYQLRAIPSTESDIYEHLEHVCRFHRLDVNVIITNTLKRYAFSNLDDVGYSLH
jgi:hypothetical protein